MLCTIYDLSLKAAGSPGHRPGESALLSIWFRTVKLCHKDGKSSSTKQFLSNVFLQVQLIKSFFCWHLELAYYLPINLCFSWSGHKWLGKAFAWARLHKKICYWLLPKLLILFCSCHPDWLLRNDIFIIDSFLFSESCNKTKEKEQETKLLKKLKKKKTAWCANNDSITHVLMYNNLITHRQTHMHTRRLKAMLWTSHYECM